MNARALYAEWQRYRDQGGKRTWARYKADSHERTPDSFKRKAPARRKASGSRKAKKPLPLDEYKRVTALLARSGYAIVKK